VTPPVKARSGHIVLEARKSFRDLARIYPEIHKRVVEANRPLSKDADPMLSEIILDENLRDLKSDRKPIGYNRLDAAGLRLIFPIREDKRLEFYVSKPLRCQEVVGLTETISTVLKKAGLKHVVEYDRSPLTNPRNGPNLSGVLASNATGAEA
jgi:hypothetical protein